MDIESLLMALGAERAEGSGSRIRFAMNGIRATFHRPHPRKETDRGALKSVRRLLVDDYLAFCAKRREEPEKPFTGKFVVRIPPDLHRKVYVAAKKSGSSLNSWVLQTLEHSTEHLS